MVLAVGFIGEKLLCRKLNTLIQSIKDQQSDQWHVVFGYAVFRLLFELAGALFFGVFGWIALYLLVNEEAAFFFTLEELIGAVVLFRICVVVSRAVLAPHSAGIRPIALSNDDALAFHRWAVVFMGSYVFIGFSGDIIIHPITVPVLQRASGVLIGLTLVIILIVFVWSNRPRLARLFSTGAAEQPASALGQLLSQSWVFMATAWLLMLWVNWAYAIFTGDIARQHSTEISWWITLLFPVGDRLVHAVLNKVTTLEFLRETSFAARRERFVSVVQSCVRAILVVVALTALAVTWNLAGADLLQSQAGQQVVWSAVDIGVTLLIAYILYEVVMSMLDKHIPEESEQHEEFEGDIGGAGATREETLAPLLRGVFLVVLAIIVILTVLSSMGVQILPLIAGASIIGIAIGFGSQKLVADIISGIFFLIDDAFRRGEYIDVGSVKGTVEKISVRSLQLRHHMGALHTIPFGEIRHLTNFSRDWVMMKLKLRLTYDTDPEKVRKLVKKLGQQLLEEEEIGEKFLQPLKSQGVYSMEDDSAMIIRVKFMTRPGDQFEIRKTVYTKIRELFEREGIEIAHRVVSVRLDGEGAANLSEEEKKRVAGAVLENPGTASKEAT